MVTCTGCALLCDDIEVVIEAGKVKETENTCLRGAGRMKGCVNRLAPSIGKDKADIESCIRKAARLLKDTESPMLFGFDNSTCEAQVMAIGLAKKLNALIDDTSSFCQGMMVEKVLKQEFRTCSLDELRNRADVLVYWGSDAQDSHPRHLSRFSYFPRGEKRQRGYEEDRTAIAIDVRESNTAKICKGNYYRIPLKGDREFMLALMDALSGKVPKYDGCDTQKMLGLAGKLKNADFGAVFAGIGLTYSIKDDIDILVKLGEMLPNFHIMPMVGHYNMRGFNEALFRETGFVNSVKFTGGEPAHDSRYSIVEALRDKSVDALLVAGSDPLSSLPGYIAKALADIPVICIDPCVTLTSKIAAVNIPAAVSGVECSGTAIRMDGKTVELPVCMENGYMSDEELLGRIMEEI